MLEALLETGFKAVHHKDFDGEDRFVVALTACAKDNDAVLEKWRPKIIFAKSPDGEKAEMYRWSRLDVPEDIYLGLLPDREFTVLPDWYVDYDADEKDIKAYLKMIGDLSYRYVLYERIDETAEWCGHMSSVVGRF